MTEFEVIMISFGIGIMCLGLYIKHILSMLLCLEFLSLMILYLLVLLVSHGSGPLMGVLIFLLIVVCEGCLGMGLMVGMVRMTGGEYLSSLSLLQ